MMIELPNVSAVKRDIKLVTQWNSPNPGYSAIISRDNFNIMSALVHVEIHIAIPVFELVLIKNQATLWSKKRYICGLENMTRVFQSKIITQALLKLVIFKLILKIALFDWELLNRGQLTVFWWCLLLEYVSAYRCACVLTVKQRSSTARKHQLLSKQWILNTSKVKQ